MKKIERVQRAQPLPNSISLVTANCLIENTLSERFTGKVFENITRAKKMFEDAGRVIGFVMKSDQV